MVSMSASPLNSYAEILTTTPNPIAMIHNGALGRCLGHEGGAHMNQISTLIKDPSELPHSFTICGYRENVLAVNQEAGGTQPWLVP